MRYEILIMAVKISIVVIWVMTPCSLVGGYRRFRGTQRLPTLKMEAIGVIWTYKTRSKRRVEKISE
jgi:hypothetical protein